MEPKIKDPKKNRRGLLKRNTKYKTRNSGTSRGMLRKMRREATGRTAVGRLVTKGARGLKKVIKEGVTGMYENYARKRRKKLEAKIAAEPMGMGKRKGRLIKRKNRYL